MIPSPTTTARRTLRSLAPALALLWLAACGGPQTPAPADALQTPEELHAAMAERMDGIRTLRARAVVEYYGDQGRVRVRDAVLVRAPADTRIETLSPFDTTLSVLLVTSRELRLWDLQNEAFWIGAPTPENIARILPIWMYPEDLARALLGGPPTSVSTPDPADDRLRWDEEAGAYRLDLPTTRATTITLWVRHGSWVIQKAIERDVDRKLLWELRSASFVPDPANAGILVPTRLRFLMPARSIDVSLEVERVVVNPELEDDLFELQPPDGIRISPL